MSHPDEGTIHGWLDGALPAGEAAAVEAHLAECGECRAAVAEARGLIAASSRILGALDNVPAGVVPKSDHLSPLIERLRAAPARTAMPVKRWPLQVWAVAATVVMAVGLGVVMQNSDRVPVAVKDVAPSVSAPHTVVAESVPPGFVPAPAAEPPMRAKALPQVASGAGGAAGMVRDVSEPTSTLGATHERQANTPAGTDNADQLKRAEAVALAIAPVPAEKKSTGELRAAGRAIGVGATGSAAMAKAASATASAPASAPAPEANCARFALDQWRSPSRAAVHSVTRVTARPGPTVNAATTVTLDYADGPRTEIGAWLLQPDTARLTVRDARDETVLRLLVSRSTGSGIGTLTSASDNAIASAAARTVPEGCAVPKPE